MSLSYKKLGFLVIVLFCVTPISAKAVNVMTFNIRYDNPTDGTNSWENRKESVLDVIRSNKAYIVGMQEALFSQVQYLDDSLVKYDYVGVGRDNGVNAGEFNPIFYRSDKFKLLDSDSFWLSENPNTPSKGWNAECYRIVTWAKFKNKKSKKIFYVFNTHFDKRVKAKRQSAKLLTKKVKSIVGSKLVIIVGDFNAKPNLRVYNLLIEELTDSQSLVEHIGPKKTFTGFKSKLKKRIDYIFTRGQIKVKYHETIVSKASDHYPVITRLILK